MEKRRRGGHRLLRQGVQQATVARRLKVSRQTVSRWAKDASESNPQAWRSRGRPGPKPGLDDQRVGQLATMLKRGPEAFGYPNALWTVERIGGLIEQEFGVSLGRSQVWNILRDRLGWSCQRPAKRARERDEDKVRHWKRYVWPRLRDRAIREGRTLVFVDESGLSQRPTRHRTWSPKGETPVIEFNFNWKNLSAMAGVSVYRFYFRLFDGSIKAPQVVDFLRHLKRQVGNELLVIWDGLQAHRSRLVKDYLASTNGGVEVTWLPAYAPELNPVEYLWGHWKNHEIPNLTSASLHELSHHARRALRRMQRRPTLVKAFWIQAELSL